MPRAASRRRLAPLVALAALAWGCGPDIGDPCTTDSACGQGRFCDLTSTDGYCTIAGCTANSCPDNSLCVTFANEESFCMALCDSDRRDQTYTTGRALEQSWLVEAPIFSAETEDLAVSLEGCREGYVCDRITAAHPFCRQKADCERTGDAERFPECLESAERAESAP